MNIDSAPAIRAITMVFQYQLRYSVVANSLLKFSRLAPFGISVEVLRVPSGLMAAEIGKGTGTARRTGPPRRPGAPSRPGATIPLGAAQPDDLVLLVGGDGAG